VTAIRPATADDVGALAAVHAEAVALAYAGIFDAGVPPPTADELVGRWALLVATPDAWVGVAEHDGATVGMVGARPSPDPDAPAGTGEIVGLHVRPMWWGQGVGGRLFDAAVEEAGRLGLARCGCGRCRRTCEPATSTNAAAGGPTAPPRRSPRTSSSSATR
jgi:GNAT superfamily N-acetyltransferase